MDAQLTQFAQQFKNYPKAQQQIQAVQATWSALAAGQLPAKSLPVLGFSVDEILTHPELMPLDDYLNDFRSQLIERYGIWHLPNQAWIQDLAGWINQRPTLEIMAGNGIITAALSKRGIPVQATDNFDWAGQDITVPHPWTQVRQLDARQAIKTLNFEVLILSWAPDTSDVDWQILQDLRQAHYQGDFIVVGEYQGATNSAAFWQQGLFEKPAALNRHHQPFDDFKDQVYLVK
ncbi:SAM-dependent methyltransferase [Lactobacillaceae bacterium L1_55_11]|nr:SAM-dependent methyltransferase [Lactobacillaceae bacterium L1_55_11]